jgi:hypothetical protein
MTSRPGDQLARFLQPPTKREREVRTGGQEDMRRQSEMSAEQAGPRWTPRTPKDQWIAAIEEHLDTVSWCLDRSQHRGPIKGYTAALLLFCIIDAMGNGLLTWQAGKHTRLDVLLGPPFDPAKLKLDSPKVENLTQWYRNKLTHTGAMALNATLDDQEGDPFTFDENGSPRILVPPLYRVVKAAWENRNKGVFELRADHKAPRQSQQLTASPYASGAIDPNIAGNPTVAETMQAAREEVRAPRKRAAAS